MRERPILFSAPMVRAILEGRKTMTRRIVKYSEKDMETFINKVPRKDVCCPYGLPGDCLWVRESWLQKGKWRMPEWPGADADDCYWDGSRDIAYKADLEPEPGGVQHNFCAETGWRGRPSIHMPRWASRILLEITETRVERLQAITEEDAIAEGIENAGGLRNWYIDYLETKGCEICGTSPLRSFQSLWASINGIDSWDANPWVWVIEFRRIQPDPTLPLGGKS